MKQPKCEICGKEAKENENCQYFEDEDNPNQPHVPMKQLERFDSLIRDITRAGGMPKSEARRRLREIILDIKCPNCKFEWLWQ